MGEGELKLLGAWPSAFAIRVKIVLKQKGLSYEYLEEDLANKSELLIKYNPVHKKIPVLIHNDKGVCESLVILQYIDEAWSETGPSVLPSDSYERAMARFWASYIDDKIPNGIRIMKGMLEGDINMAAEQFAATLQLLEETFHNMSKGKSFFDGDNIGYLDIALGSHIGWIKAVEKIIGVRFLDKEKIPGLVDWAERFCAHKAVKDLMPDSDKLVEFSSYKKSVSGFASTK